MALIDRSEFSGGQEGTYLYTAGEGLVPHTAIDAIQMYFERKFDAVCGHKLHEEIGLEVRSRLARLMDAQPDDIALLGNSSQGISAIYSLIDWQPGDNVVLVTNDLEFPSVVLPAVKRVKAGQVEMRVVDRKNWIISPEDIAAAIDARTRLVFVSHVSYRTGYRMDLEQIGDMVRRSNALLAVDATQSLGVIPVPASACDFLVATSCKWLLSPHGIGVFYWNRERLPNIEPHDIGWYSVIDDLEFPYELKPSASRFELGGLAWPSIYAMNASLRILTDTGVDDIERHVTALGGKLIDELQAFDIEIITPSQPEQRAGIVSWLDADPAETARNLARHDVYVSGSSGRVRVAFHLYNDTADIDALITALKAIV